MSLTYTVPTLFLFTDASSMVGEFTFKSSEHLTNCHVKKGYKCAGDEDSHPSLLGLSTGERGRELH